MSTLTGKTALVTGSTSGLGRAIADTLAAAGARVVLSGRNQERGEQAVAEIRAAGGKADFVAADLHDAGSAQALASQALELAGSIDILVNNAGVYSFAPTADTLEAEFDRIYDINVKVPFFLVGAVAPSMVARGGGAIVNITTAIAERGTAGAAAYGSAKAAAALLTKSWAAEYGPSGIRVNAVSPGPIYSPGTAALGEGAIESFAVGIPAERVGTPQEVADAVTFLASDAASYIHGTILAVDGGKAAV
jgi:NAD(P)-dependent dehydrogenase (short-subunit alcohol dehydrogenase family)